MTRRLINRPQPVPLESLASLVQRLRWANHYDTERAWLRALVPRLPADLNTLWRPEHYQAVSSLTGLDIPTLVGLTLHRFAARYQEPSPWPQDLPGTMTPSPTVALPLWDGRNAASVKGVTAVCPHCWRERHAILLPWSLVQLTACRRHHALLLERCPCCGLGLDLSAQACPHCAQRIAAMPTVSIAAHRPSVALAEAAWSATGSSEERFPPACLGLAADHPLRRVGTPSLLWSLQAWAEELLLRTGRSPLFAPEALLPGVPLPAPGDGWYATPCLGGVDLATRHHGLVAAWRLLQEWDQTWSQAVPLTDHVAASRTGAGVPYPVVLGSGSAGPRWTLADTAWLTTVWDHTASGYPWGRDDLPAYPAVRSTTWMYRWGSQDLALGVHAAATYVQLAEDEFVALVTAGVLPSVYQPVPAQPASWKFTERTLHQALQALLGRLPVRPFRDLAVPAVDLSWVLDCAARHGLGVATVLRAVGDGTLPALRTRASVQLVDLWFERAPISAYLREHQWPAYERRLPSRDRHACPAQRRV